MISFTQLSSDSTITSGCPFHSGTYWVVYFVGISQLATFIYFVHVWKSIITEAFVHIYQCLSFCQSLLIILHVIYVSEGQLEINLKSWNGVLIQNLVWISPAGNPGWLTKQQAQKIIWAFWNLESSLWYWARNVPGKQILRVFLFQFIWKCLEASCHAILLWKLL